MYVFIRPSIKPFVIETNLAWATPYWEKRKQGNPNIHWKLVKG